MQNIDIGFDYKETLYDAIAHGIEYCCGLDFEVLGYATIEDDIYFPTEEGAVIYSLMNDDIFVKCRNFDLTTLVVPAYDADGELLFYLSYDDAIKL